MLVLVLGLASDVERTVIGRALETAARRRHTLERLTVFMDVLGQPRPRPGARPRDEKHIAILRQRDPAVTLELR